MQTPAAPPPALAAANFDHEIGWMGMFNSDLVAWLEKENTAPDSVTAPLYTAPDKGAPGAGSLLMIATPGKGLSALYIPVDVARSPQQITPDLYDPDWGYGPPYFHITISERRGQWVRLAEGPIPNGTWVNMDDISNAPITESIEQGNILITPYGDLYVLRVEDGAIVGRPEQSVDMWCGEGTPPPPRMDSTEVRVEDDSLYTRTGHLRVKIKYTRGC